MENLGISTERQAKHPAHGSSGKEHSCTDTHSCLDISCMKRALTRPPASFVWGAVNCATEIYERYFNDSLERLRGEQRYRVFANIERVSGRFPTAKWRRPDGSVTDITVWCS